MDQTENIHQSPRLTPITSDWMNEVFGNKSLLKNLLATYDSPVNLLHTKPFRHNFDLYQKVFEKHNLNHQVFFARKANTCKVFAKEANAAGFGIDVASYNELKQCLELGCNPERLVLTAAIKPEKLVRLAIQNGVLMIVDNRDEFSLIQRLASELNQKARIGIRVSGFLYNGKKLYSRFGFDIDKVKDLMLQTFSNASTTDLFDFEGFQFHLDGYSIKERATALFQLIHLIDELEEYHISTGFIDMGGGLLMNYLTSKNEWKTFWNQLKQSLLGKRKPITFRNNGLGYHIKNNTIEGTPNVYPYFNETPKEKFLDQILSTKNEVGKTVASLLHEKNIELRIEPGRSLLDQCGLTITRVIHRKKDQENNWLVGLEMNRSQLFSSSEDFLVDPVYIPIHDIGKPEKPESVYFTGGYCLEGDIILKRKIELPRLPEIGNIICFVNTAGYIMHFYETRSHLYDFSANLVFHPESGEIIPDENIT